MDHEPGLKAIQPGFGGKARRGEAKLIGGRRVLRVIDDQQSPARRAQGDIERARLGQRSPSGATMTS